MKKLILKTAIVTVCITLILAVSAFGIASLSAPSFMMRITASLGLDVMSGDYAYAEYERSGSLYYLARSAEIAAGTAHYRTAEERYGQLTESEGFSEFCAEQDKAVGSSEYVKGTFEQYVYAQSALVRYKTGEKQSAVEYAEAHCDRSFPANNVYIVLTVEGIGANDKEFCALLSESMASAGFAENEDFNNIKKILEEFLHE